MTTYSSILAWRIPWTEEPGGHSPRGCKELDMTKQLTRAHAHTHTHTHTQILDQCVSIFIFLQVFFVSS